MAPVECVADPMAAILESNGDIVAPYDILEVRCEGDIGAVRVNSSACGGPKTEVKGAFRWNGTSWDLLEVENSRNKWGCVGEAIP